MATKTLHSVLERFERVATAQRLPNHAELEELAEIASDLQDAAEALMAASESFREHVETLVDPDSDRDDKREARDVLPDEAQTIYEKLDALSAYTVQPDTTIRL